MRVPVVAAVTAWDVRTFARGCAIALATLGVAYVVTAASDEGGIAWGERAGRALPVAPVCAAVGAWLALAPGRARGEDVALAALGRSPWERHAAAIAGGAVIAMLAALTIALVHRVDVRGFYPRAEEAIVWRPSAGGAFASDDGRWSVSSDGVPTRAVASTDDLATAESPRALPRGARASAALATALAGLALPMLAAGARSRRRVALALAAVAATVLLTVLAFQAAAASRAPALLAPTAPLLLLAAAATRYRASPWRKARYPR